MCKVSAIFIVALLIFSTGCRDEGFRLSTDSYAANGVSSGVIELNSSRDDAIILPSSECITVLAHKKEGPGCEKLYFRSTTQEGSLTIRSSAGHEIRLTFYKVGNDIDQDQDGFPDSAELVSESDRHAFRSWFVRIAEAQFLKTSYSWHEDQQDCAGLIRFCYKEALKVHDTTWNRRTLIPIDKNLADVARFNYPKVPLLGKALFRVQSGTFQSVTQFSSFADAATLIAHNAVFVSKSLDDALHGDLLFYYNSSDGNSPFHSMIVSKQDEKLTLIYHTGGAGGVKRVSPSYLDVQPNFWPSAENRNFLGVYRLKIVE